jgi:hypothetical protein
LLGVLFMYLSLKPYRKMLSKDLSYEKEISTL